ncbi:hypothetical protein QR680_007696 [Steinernema hermaphroditum]|uniref:Uncharacterized protein n=1 Tax=Steinernema hermaphroditum TaxID=289476 RepID=A0AA39IDZ8_9BILA|nr:hypothetical protein QR680_007696 [Steinernema hermaphroditum]
MAGVLPYSSLASHLVGLHSASMSRPEMSIVDEDSIRYGLRSPTFSLQVASLSKFIQTVPKQLISENSFVDTLLSQSDELEEPFAKHLLLKTIEFARMVNSPGNYVPYEVTAAFLNLVDDVYVRDQELEDGVEDLKSLEEKVQGLGEDLRVADEKRAAMRARLFELERRQVDETNFASRSESLEKKCRRLEEELEEAMARMVSLLVKNSDLEEKIEKLAWESKIHEEERDEERSGKQALEVLLREAEEKMAKYEEERLQLHATIEQLKGDKFSLKLANDDLHRARGLQGAIEKAQADGTREMLKMFAERLVNGLNL